jgi:hypothetical protein
LEEKQLSPVPIANATTLIRRVTYDLTGIPPSPAEIEGFTKDASPEAFAKVVDRSLLHHSSANVGDATGSTLPAMANQPAFPQYPLPVRLEISRLRTRRD